MKVLFIVILMAVFFASCEMGMEVKTTSKIINENEKLVYQCLDCGAQWCQEGSSIVDAPYFDTDDLDDVGTDPGRPKCINKNCGSYNVTIIGEIDEEGEFIAYNY